MKKFLRLASFLFYFVVYKIFICKRQVPQWLRKCTEFTRISFAALINFFRPKCVAYLRAVPNTIVIPLSTVFTQISTVRAGLIRVITEISNLKVYYIQVKMCTLGLFYIQDRLLHLGLLHKCSVNSANPGLSLGFSFIQNSTQK